MQEPSEELARSANELEDSAPADSRPAIGRVSAPPPEVAAARYEPVDAAAAAQVEDREARRARNQALVPPPTADVIATREQAPLRAVSPRAAASAPAMPSAGAEVEGAQRVQARLAVRRDQVTTEWPIIRRASARDLLGADLVGIPGLAVRQIRSSPANDGTLLVEQALDSSTVIQLYQRRFGAERDAAGYGTTERLARFVGELRVEIAGPLSQDSLNKLLEQLKPLP